MTEIIMHIMGWTDLWYAHPLHWSRNRWHAGVWTGEHFDLLCIRQCETNKEAEKYLSPGASTVLGACIMSLIKYYKLNKTLMIKEIKNNLKGHMEIKR